MSDPSSIPPEPQGVQFQMQLPPDLEVGVHADYANVWHTPTSFVLDFLAVKSPPHATVDPATGAPVAGPTVIEARVTSRVRVPPEQIFPLIAALQEQGNAWLAEQGRSGPPDNWVG